MKFCQRSGGGIWNVRKNPHGVGVWNDNRTKWFDERIARRMRNGKKNEKVGSMKG